MTPTPRETNSLNTQSLNFNPKSADNQGEKGPGKLNQHVVKPIGAAHAFAEAGMIIVGIVVAMVAIPVAMVAIPALFALSLSISLAPAALIGFGIYLACTGGAPLAAAGLICGGLAFGILQGGVLTAVCRKKERL